MAEVNVTGEVVQIPLSDEERISGVPTVAHLQESLITLHRDGMFHLSLNSYLPIGIVILNNAVEIALSTISEIDRYCPSRYY